jgi:hypothetical protein
MATVRVATWAVLLFLAGCGQAADKAGPSSGTDTESPTGTTHDTDTVTDGVPGPEDCSNGADDDGDGDADCADDDCDCDSDDDGYDGQSLGGDDCDDADPNVHPNASEVCNDGVDDDCNGVADDEDPGVDPLSRTRWFTDADGDTYGDRRSFSLACAPAAGDVVDGTDCDDGNAAVSPAGAEVCNNLDDDCDGLFDDDDPSLDILTASLWYADLDGDGSGDPAVSTLACAAPPGYVENADDCDDGNPALDDASLWDADADGDGYGEGSAFGPPGCAPPGPGDVPAGGPLDCVIDDPAVHPGATEICLDGIDQDCNGSDQCDTHIGNDVEFAAASGHSPGFLLGSLLVVPSDFTVNALALIGKSAVANVQMALYTSSGGHPDRLVVESSVAPVPVGVLELPVAPTFLPAGDYWIVANYDAPASVGIEYPPTDEVDYIALPFGSPLPDPFGVPSTYLGQRFNYYIVGG